MISECLDLCICLFLRMFILDDVDAPTRHRQSPSCKYDSIIFTHVVWFVESIIFHFNHRNAIMFF